MKKLIYLFLFSVCFVSKAQKTQKPKLVIGIVIDQMRYDYLQKFQSHFGSKGFNKIIKNGTTFENAHYNYIPTYTAVGHASIYTGTTPKNHGIIGNSWYDKTLKKSIYVVDDKNHQTIGSDDNQGRKSPYRLTASTVTDQLKLAQNFKGKVIGLAIKDRSAILPVGHAADIAYWFNGGEIGNWISSTYYKKELPAWVTTYNKTNKTKLQEYLNTTWTTKKDIKNYSESINDQNSYEGLFKGEDRPTFPHNLKILKALNGGYSILKTTPFGNTMTLDFAKEIIKNEKLGVSNIHSDFLAISISPTDYVGHKYGAASKEIEDTYIRLNNDIDDFINSLNKQVGKNNYVLFITADHAVVQIPNYLKDHKIPGAYFSKREFLSKLNTFIEKIYHSKNMIENFSNDQIFLNHQEVSNLGLKLTEVENTIINEIINYPHIYKAISANTMQKTEFSKAPMSLLQEGYNQKISGDILLTLKPAVIGESYKKTGTTHGSGYNYDTHIPILFYGKNICKGKKIKKPVNITQIAPTLSNILEIQEPNMSSHKILLDVFKN